MRLETTHYYEEFLRYVKMARWLQENCNLGLVPQNQAPFDDGLIRNVKMYDSIERKYSAFNSLLHDMFYALDDHPYKHKMTFQRSCINEKFQDARDTWGLKEWLYVFFVHRLTGSGLHYGKIESGYHNTALPQFYDCEDLGDLIHTIVNCKEPKFSSCGYQIAAFPKPTSGYDKGGDYYFAEILPKMVTSMADYMESTPAHSFHEMMDWIANFMSKYDCRLFRFQFAAVLADIADYMPEYINNQSMFFYGTSAIDSLGYFAIKPRGLSREKFLDKITDMICADINVLPYNVVDIACDSIRWIENYINPKHDYKLLDLDKTWSSCEIKNHPFGRQKAMLRLKLVDTFNGKPHPSGDQVIRAAGMSIDTYMELAYEKSKS